MDDLRLTDERLCVLDHPLVEHKLSIMRDENTTPSQFRQMVHEISMIEVFEATRDLPTEPVEVKTPLQTMTGKHVPSNLLAVVPILRAGMGMLDGVLSVIPSAAVGVAARLASVDRLPTALPLLSAAVSIAAFRAASLAAAFALLRVRVVVLGLLHAVCAALSVRVLLLRRALAPVLSRINATAFFVKFDNLALGTVFAQVKARTLLSARSLGSKLGGEVVFHERLRRAFGGRSRLFGRRFHRLDRRRRCAAGERAHNRAADGIFVRFGYDFARLVDLAYPVKHALQTEARHSSCRANRAH